MEKVKNRNRIKGKSNKYNYSYDKREDLEFLRYLLYKVKSQLKQEFPNSKLNTGQTN